MFSPNSTTNKFKKINYNQRKTNSIKRSSSCANQINQANNEIPNIKNLNINPKIKLNMTNYMSLSSPKMIENNKKLPLLGYNKSKKDLLKIYNNKFEKMRKYKIKLRPKKQIKTQDIEDKLFLFLYQNGLHYSFSPNKYIIGDNYDYFSKYRNRQKPKKASDINNSNNIKDDTVNIKDNNINSDISKNKSEQNKELNKEQGLFYSTIDEDDDDTMSYQNYMKMQSIADVRLRPKLGDISYDLVNYIRKIDLIRKGVVNNLINQINNVENRYNIERPKEDSKFSTKLQGLFNHKWKNNFSLRDYQELFSENLRGKISNKNYDIMMKNFRDISHMCFSKGNTNFSKVDCFEDI